jgi:hypothetical protein
VVGVGVGAGLVLLKLARVKCWQYFLSLLATVRGNALNLSFKALVNVPHRA